MDVDVSGLAPLLERQLDRYQRLRALSVQQADLVGRVESEKLLGVLSQRQVLVDELSSIDRELEPYRQRWEQVAGTLDDSTRARVGELVEAVRGHLEVIVRQDEQDRVKLEAVKAGIGSELGRTRTAGAAAQAYGGEAGSRPRYTNHEA